MALDYVASSVIPTGNRIARKLLATYVDTSSTSTPSWELLGVRVADASIELNADVEQSRDICGNSYATYEGVQPSISMEPFSVIAGSVMHKKLMQIYYDKDWPSLEHFKIMNVFGWLTNGTATSGDEKLAAEVHSDCTIGMSSIGGSDNVDMPITIYYSNNCSYGTVDGIKASPTFTAAS